MMHGYIVQAHYGCGWEDECVEFTLSEGRKRLKEYQSKSQYAVRLIKRKTEEK